MDKETFIFQPETEIALDNIGLDTNSSTSMASILPQNVKEDRQLAVSVASSENLSSSRQASRYLQTVVLISEENLREKGIGANYDELEVHEPEKNSDRRQCVANDPTLLT